MDVQSWQAQPFVIDGQLLAAAVDPRNLEIAALQGKASLVALTRLGQCQ